MNYKKILMGVLFFMGIGFFSLQAQNSRTAQTIVADVLAKMPAASQNEYNRQIRDLASTGEEGVLLIVKMMNAPGKGSNAPFEYALSGLANYVSGSKDQQVKQTTINAFQKAVTSTNIPEIQAFLKAQLLMLGVGYSPAQVSEDIIPAKTNNTPVHFRIAALEKEIKAFASNEKELTKKILEALKDPSIEYRCAALNFASPFASKELYIELAKAAQKGKPNIQTDILNWFGNEIKIPSKSELIKGLEINYKLTFNQILIDLLKSKNMDVKEAAAWTMVKVGDISFIPLLANLLTSRSSSDIKLGKETLTSFKGNVPAAVSQIIKKANDEGKIASIELLASRRASSHISNIFELTKSNSPKVQETAFAALKDMADERDFTRLCGMLETSRPETLKPLQQAVIASISTLPQNDQATKVKERILQTGENNRYLYFTILAAIGDKESLPDIINGFKQDDVIKKEAAFEALLNWKGPEATSEIYAIASDKSQTDSYANRALTRFVAIALNQTNTPENRFIYLRKAMEAARSNEQKNDILQRIGRTGTFLAMIYAGEFLDNRTLQQTAANAVMNIALNNKNYTGTIVRSLLNKVSVIIDNKDADYQRENIRKHLSDMPEEEGFVSVFNGKDLTGWKGLVDDPIKRSKMTPAQLQTAQVKADELMHKNWIVENGSLVYIGPSYDNICTNKQYTDFEMYVDWMIIPGDLNADGGIYLRGSPQVQIWETSRIRRGEQEIVGSGGLFNNQINPSKPLKFADNPAGEWNTFFIKMVGDRVTIYLNGILVVDNTILENYWDRKIPIFPVEQIELQAHGTKVYHRNIFIKELKRAEPFTLSTEEKKEGYQILFDGTNMYEWTGNLKDYRLMDDGTITLVPSEGSGGNLYTKKDFSDFIIRFEFQLTPAANNGLGIRTPLTGDAAYEGMEIQILDNEHPIYANLQPYQYHGSVYGIIPAKRGFLKPVGEWNYQEVIAKGDNIKVTLNGVVILDGNIREATKNGSIDGRQHPGLFNKSGRIAFLGHGDPLKFRNIRIKELK